MPARRPSRRHDLLAWVVPRLRKSRELDTVEPERARIERWHASQDRSFPTRAVPGFSRRYSVVTEDVQAVVGSGVPVVRHHPARARPDPDRRLPARRRVRRGDRRVPRAVRRPAGLRARTRGSCCPTTRWRPSTPGATRTTRSSTWWRGTSRRVPAASCSLGTPPAVASRSRSPVACATAAAPAQPPAAARAVGRPDHEHAGHRRGHADRPVAVHRQAPRLRVVVGGIGGGPRPAGGLAGAGRPRRAAAGADVLRHPGHPRAGLPAARARGPRTPAGT